MTPTDDLKARLRAKRISGKRDRVCTEAATRIEHLEAELAKVREAVIEECARVAEGMDASYPEPTVRAPPRRARYMTVARSPNEGNQQLGQCAITQQSTPPRARAQEGNPDASA